MSEDKKEYDRFKGLLNGEQTNVLDSELLMAELSNKAELKNAKADSLYLLHDPCDIRKRNATDLEYLGKVQSLDKRIVDGYRTFNSVLIDPKKKSLDLLHHQTYSTSHPDYVKASLVKEIEKGSLKNEELKEKIEKGDYHNTSTIYKAALVKESQALKQLNPSVKITHISDREFDDAELFSLIDKDLKDFFIQRIKVNRNSNEEKQVLTPTGKISKKVAFEKLVNKDYAHSRSESINKIRLNKKVYQNVKRIIEWEDFELEGSVYKVVRITLLTREGKAIFKQPMLLLTNRKIRDIRQASLIYRAYLMRSKIEMVFKFCKTQLGWESIQVRDFKSIKNLLALVFFIAGYFYEIKKGITKDYVCIKLAEIEGGKGKVTLFYILEGFAKVANYQLVQTMIKENKIDLSQLNLSLNEDINHET